MFNSNSYEMTKSNKNIKYNYWMMKILNVKTNETKNSIKMNSLKTKR